VLGRDRVGGMQTPEVVPFARKEDAQQFMRRHGGEIADYHLIPPASILEPAVCLCACKNVVRSSLLRGSCSPRNACMLNCTLE